MNFLRSKLFYRCCMPSNISTLRHAALYLSPKKLKKYLSKNSKKITVEELDDMLVYLYLISSLRDKYHKTMTVLLQCGADPLVLLDNVETLLFRAFSDGEFVLALEFIKYIPDVDKPIELIQFKTALHVATHNKCHDIMLLLLKRGANVNATMRPYGFTPLHLAMGQSDPEVVKILLDNGADMNARNDHLETPLHWGFYYKGTHELVSILVERGSDLAARDKLGKTPLHQFLHRRADSVEVCELMLRKGADPSATDVSGNTPFHSLTLSCTLSKLYPSITLAEMLVRAGSSVNAQNSEGQTPIQVAARFGMDKSFLYCLLRLGSDIDLPDATGWTLLRFYVFMHNQFGLEILKYSALEERKGKFKFTDAMLDLIATSKKYNAYLSSCKAELDSLAAIKVGDEISLSEVLFAPLSLTVRFATNTELAAKVNKVDARNFPIYGLWLTKRYRKGLRRREAEGLGLDFLSRVSKGALNVDCTKEILKYIPTDDLERLKYLNSEEMPRDCRLYKNPDYFKTNFGHYFDEGDYAAASSYSKDKRFRAACIRLLY